MSKGIRWAGLSLAAALGATAFHGVAVADDDDHDDDRRGFALYEVSITNLTPGQVFSPPVLVTHRAGVHVFVAGAPASDGLAMVAEAGAGGTLVTELEEERGVFEAVATGTPIGPGGTEVYEIASRGRANRISVVSMLVNSNDAFVAIDGKRLPRGRGGWTGYPGAAYDAGSEGNNQVCAFVPGPACPAASGNARDTAGAEGFVHVHNGIHEFGDLAPELYDWRNPVAQIVVRRVR